MQAHLGQDLGGDVYSQLSSVSHGSHSSSLELIAARTRDGGSVWDPKRDPAGDQAALELLISLTFEILGDLVTTFDFRAPSYETLIANIVAD